MKINPKGREISYFGNTLLVGPCVVCVAVDGGGDVFGYDEPPRADLMAGLWVPRGYCIFLGKAEFEGEDWRDTLVHV